MKDRFNKPLVVKKSVFLECVRDTYQYESDNYLLALSNALMIIVSVRRGSNHLQLNEYKGVVQL